MIKVLKGDIYVGKKRIGINNNQYYLITQIIMINNNDIDI